MITRAVLRLGLLLTWATLLDQVPRASACATCFGVSDSDLARGMNVGILVLLGVILSVLAAISAFFVMLARRAAAIKAAGANAPAMKEGA